MASNSHGNSNELEMANYLNNKKYSELNLTMKEFVKYICQTRELPLSENTVILSRYESNNKLKQDIYITIENVEMGISLKMGSGNSCHQEKIEDFISFIKAETNASNEICDLWRLFIWADGTLDGSGPTTIGSDGKIACRCGTTKFKQKYPEERKVLQQYLDENIEALITHSVFVGEHNSNVDFVYHGTYKQGRWISKQEVIDFQKTKIGCAKRACLYLGSLTVQMWNPSENGKNEHKRGEIQLKYGQMENDFNLIMKDSTGSIGTFFGDLEEFDLSKTMNRNKDNSMWRTLLPNIKDYTNFYIVKVSSNQLSKLSEKKVKTKSDAYAIKALLNRDMLLRKEYVLDESDLKNVEYEIQHETGISIKIRASKNYTYQKFTKNSFYRAFSNIDDVEFWFISLLIYSDDKERYKNEKIISDLGYTLERYFEYVQKLMQLSVSDTNTSSFWNSVRRTAQDRIKREIKNNSELAENIFTGKHWFDSPYHAIFLYESGKLRKNIVTDFEITTGSGRSKGKYTIEIKPS